MSKKPSQIPRLYQLLGEMIEYARNEDNDNLTKANKKVDTILIGMSIDDRLAFDNCRQSSIMTVTLSIFRTQFLKDAEERYKVIQTTYNPEIPKTL